MVWKLLVNKHTIHHGVQVATILLNAPSTMGWTLLATEDTLHHGRGLASYCPEGEDSNDSQSRALLLILL